MNIVFLLFFSFFLTTVNSQERAQTLQTLGEDVSISPEKGLLKKANALKDNDPQASIMLATESLIFSENKGDDLLSAQAHLLLAKVYQPIDADVSFHHLTEVTRLNKNIDDKWYKIMSSIEDIQELLIEKSYVQADEKIKNLLPMVLQYGETLPIARVIMVQGDSYYRQNKFEESIEQYIDALKYLSSEGKTIHKLRGDSYTEIAQSYKRLKHRENTALFYTKALQVYTDIGHEQLTARTLNTLAEAERYLGNLVAALDYSTRSLEIHKKINDPEGRAKALAGAGTIYRNIGRYEKSLQHFHDSHLYYQAINDVSGIAKTSNQMGLIYTKLKQFDSAKSFYQLTMDLPEAQVDLITRATALREMAVIDTKAGNYEPALVSAKQAIDIYQRKNEKLKESQTARIVADIYRAQDDDVNAITYYEKSLSLAENNELYIIKAQNSLAGMLIGKNKNNNKKAIDLLKKSLAMSIEIDNKEYTLYAYRKLRQAEKRNKNINKSLSYAEKEIELTEVIQKEKDKKKLFLAKANLHSHKLEVELASLKEKARFSQLELAKKNNEIEIVEQQSTIHELELIKNRYATIALASLLAVCVFLVVYIYRRFSASKEKNKELDYLAKHDPLTGCYNRRLLFELLNRDFADKGLLDEYCIIMADIDHFKAVNDNHGHNIGDIVLSGVAKLLQESVRKNDLVARFGGEEFCIVLPGAAQKQALILAESMREKVETNEFANIKVTCSFGITSIKYNAIDPQEFIEQADFALYQSKYNGRNKVTLWEQAFKEAN